MKSNLRVRSFFVLLAILLCIVFFLISKLTGSSAALFAPSLTATKSVGFAPGGDADGDGKADPGDTLQYSVTVTNSGTDATGVSLNDQLSNLTTLSPGSTNISPFAVSDSYNTIGNVNLVVPTGAGSLLSNDSDPDGGTLSILSWGNTLATVNANPAGTTAASGNGGSLTVNSNGSFSYNPPRGGTTTETFTYKLSDGQGGTDIGQVTIAVSGKIWFINDNTGACSANCDGRLTNPYTSIAAFQAANTGTAPNATTGDNIFIYESPTSYGGPITLLNNQRLIGQDATATLLALTGLSSPGGTNQLPVMNATPATSVNITSGGNAINLGQGNTLRGFTVGATTGTKISGTSFGTVTIGDSTLPDVTLNGNGQALNLNTGTFGATTGFVGVASTSSTAQGINLAGVGGTASFGSTTVSGSATQGILVGTTTANINFGNTTVGTASAGSGGTNSVSLQNNSSGTRTFGTLTLQNNNGPSNAMFLMGAGGGNVTAGTTTLSGVSGTGAAIDIQSQTAAMTASFGATSVTMNGPGGCANFGGTSTGNGGPITLGSFACTNSGGPGIIGLNNTGTITVTNNTGAVSSTSGAAAVSVTGTSTASRTPINLNFSGISASGGTSGIVLTNTSGSFSGGAGTIGGTSGPSISGTGNTATITYNGAVTKTSADAIVAITTQTGGTVTLGGAYSCNTSCQGISLTNNTGGTINFTGGMNLSTGPSPAFTATGGGTVNVTQNNATVVNTLTTTTGTALNVANTNIGASGITFRSIAAGTAAGGPANGITLNNTGSLGGLTISGNGSPGTGGTIQRTTGSGLSLTSVGGSAAFSDLNLSNTAGDGITASSVRNFSCSLCNITNAGTSANKDGLRLTELTGAAALTNVVVTGSTSHGVFIQNTSATLASLTVTGGTYGSPNNAFATAGSGMEVLAVGTGIITAASVSGATFSSNFATGLQSFAQDTAQIGDITVSGCTFTNNGAAAVDFDAGTGSNPQMKFHFLNNLTITGNGGPTVNVFSSSTATGGLIQGRIDGNHVGTTGITDSGSTSGPGIRVFLQGVPGNITIVNNTVRATACSRGIDIETLGPQSAGGANRQSDVVVVGNDVNNFSSDCAFPLNDIYLSSDNQAGTSTTLRAEVHGNTIKTAGATPANTDFPFDNAEWLYFQRRSASSTAQLVDFNGPHANANTAIATTQTSGSAKTDGNVALIPGPINTVAAVDPLGERGFDLAAGSYGSPGKEQSLFGGQYSANLSQWHTHQMDTVQSLLKTISGVQNESSYDTGDSGLGRPPRLNNAALGGGERMIEYPGFIAQSFVVGRLGELGAEGPRGATVDARYQLFKAGDQVVNFAGAAFNGILNMLSPTVYASGETVSNTPFTLPAGKSVTITFKATVNTGPFAAGVNTIDNMATVSGTNFSTVATNTSSIPLDAAPDLSVTDSDGSTATEPGGLVSYTINYSNGNAVDGQGATGVTLTQTVPANTTFTTTGSSTGWSCGNGSPAGTVCTKTIGALNANTNGSAVFNVIVNSALPATALSLSDTVSIADDGMNGPDLNSANNSASDTDTNVIGLWLGTANTDWQTASNWSNGIQPPDGNNISVPNVPNKPSVTTADVSINDLTLNGDDLTIGANRTISASGNVTLGANVVLGLGKLSIGDASTISRTTGQIDCTLEKSFLSPQAFTYPVGTTGNYSPVDVNIINGPGILSVLAHTGTAPATPPFDATKMLQRYWALNGSGITADVTFHYLDADIPETSDETQYRIFRILSDGTALGFQPDGTNVILNTSANTFKLVDTRNFSDWTAGNPFVPTAAPVSVSGRVMTAAGTPIFKAAVTIIDQNGNARTVLTNPFGYYSFDGVESGETYVISVTSKRYTFASRAISVDDEINDLDFIAR